MRYIANNIRRICKKSTMNRTLIRLKQGFTLIEIVVVIAIVALLFAAGVTSYSKVRQNSRDSIRKSDLLNIRGALEQYRNINTSYPATIFQLVTDGYMPKEPLDPQLECSYTYNLSSPPTGYTVCTDLEGDASFLCTKADCRQGATPCTPANDTCLSNLQ